MIYREPTLLLVAAVTAASAFLSLANRAYAALLIKHPVVVGGGYSEQAFHSPPSETFLDSWVGFVLKGVALSLLAIDSLKVFVAPLFGVISRAATAPSFLVVKFSLWFLGKALPASSHYGRIDQFRRNPMTFT